MVVNAKLVRVGDLVYLNISFYLTEYQPTNLPYLLNRFEAEVVCLELVCQTGGLGVKFFRDVPQTRGKLKTLMTHCSRL